MVDLSKVADKVISTDVLVIGTECAGAMASIYARRQNLNVLAVTKGYLGKSGASVTSDGDTGCDGKTLIERFGLKGYYNINDSPDKMFEDMIKASKYISNQKLVEIHVKEAPEMIQELINFNVTVEEKRTKSAGHTYIRGVHVPGDALVSGFAYEIGKLKIPVIEHMMMTDILTKDQKVIGAVGIKLDTGHLYVISAKAIILCTGGALRIYPHTTAPEDCTGDGNALAFNVGAEMIDMEFPMFIPYTLLHPKAMDGVDFPHLLSGCTGAIAMNRLGDRYMQKWDPVKLERTTRDINSIAAAYEVWEGRGSDLGGVYISVKHLPERLLEQAVNKSNVISGWRYGKFNVKEIIPNLKEEGLEVGPACHYQNGGIRINEKCETNILGLYAAGEGTGSIMGGNRISGQAVMAAMVFGARGGRFMGEYVKNAQPMEIDVGQVETVRKRVFSPLSLEKGVDAIELRKEMQKLAIEKVGILRSKENLEYALPKIEEMKDKASSISLKSKHLIYNREWLNALETTNMIQVLELIARASLMRTESRGALYRLDYPKTDNVNWLKNIIVSKKEGKIHLKTEPVVSTKIKPPEGVFEYGRIDY